MLNRLNQLVILAFALTMVVAGPGLAQGAYTLTIEGNLTDANNAPGAFMTVLLTTNAGEGITAQTDISGHFVLSGTVRGSQGELTVKSPNSSNVVFGKMSLDWSAGGFGAKTLVADLAMNRDGEMGIAGGLSPEWGTGGTEAPLPAEPGESDTQTEPADQSPAVTPTQPVQAVVTPVGLPDAPPEPSGSNAGLIALVVIGLVLGLGLIGGGVWFMLKRN